MGDRKRQAVIIFGATSGIAQAVIRRYAERGARLALVARDRAKLDAVAKDARARGGEVLTTIMDAAAPRAYAHAVHDVLAFLPRPDVILFVHGELGDEAKLRRGFGGYDTFTRVNFLSHAELTFLLREALTPDCKPAWGYVSSVAGDRGRQSNYLYGASKAALTAFTSGLRQELFRLGMPVLTINPGFVATKMTAHLNQGPLFAKPESVAKPIIAALDRRASGVLYVPGFWRMIMFIIRHIPESVFRRLRL